MMMKDDDDDCVANRHVFHPANEQAPCALLISVIARLEFSGRMFRVFHSSVALFAKRDCFVSSRVFHP